MKQRRKWKFNIYSGQKVKMKRNDFNSNSLCTIPSIPLYVWYDRAITTEPFYQLYRTVQSSRKHFEAKAIVTNDTNVPPIRGIHSIRFPSNSINRMWQRRMYAIATMELTSKLSSYMRSTIQWTIDEHYISELCQKLAENLQSVFE